jgi:hypothetical protein
MPLYDPNTGDTSAVAVAADTTSLESSGTSLLDSAQNWAGGMVDGAANFASKYVPLAGLAAANSFANTAIEFGNWTGMTDAKKWSIENELGDPSDTNSYRPDLVDYYKDHTQAVEAGGLLAGSLIPGLAGIKALKAFQAWEGGGAISRATNIFNGIRQGTIEAAKAAAESDAAGFGTFGSIRAAKFAAVAAGVGDQALQGIAYEAMTTATMKASPLTDDNDWRDIASNMAGAAIVQGGIGGLVDGIGALYSINKSLRTIDQAATGSRQQGLFQEKNQLIGADVRTSAVLQAAESMKAPENKYQAGIQQDTKQAAFETAVSTLKPIVEDYANDPVFAGSIARRFVNLALDAARNLGDPSAIADKIMGLTKIAKFTGPDSLVIKPSTDVLYLNKYAAGSEKAKQGIFASDIFTSEPHPNAVANWAYRKIDSSLPTKIAIANSKGIWQGEEYTQFQTAEEAFKQGYDVFINSRGNPIVNENGNYMRVARPGQGTVLGKTADARFQQTGQATTSKGNPITVLGGQPIRPLGDATVPFAPGTELSAKPTILNLFTGAETDAEKIIPTVGDYGGIKVTSSAVSYGDGNIVDHAAGEFDYTAGSAADAQTRYLWAAEHGTAPKTDIASTDIASLEKMYQEAVAHPKGWSGYMQQLDGAKITVDGESPSDSFTSADDLLSQLRDTKVALINKMLKQPDANASEIAMRANVPEDFIASRGTSMKTIKDITVSQDQLEQATHVQAIYNVGNLVDDTGHIRSGLLQQQYRIKLATDAADTAGTAWLRDLGVPNADSALPGMKLNNNLRPGALDSDIGGVGGGFLSFSRAAYGTMAEQAERTGRNISEYVKNYLTNKIHPTLMPAVEAIRSDPMLGQEVNTYIYALRSSPENYMALPEDARARYFPDAAPGSIRVLRNALSKDEETGANIWDKDYLPEGYVKGDVTQTPGQKNFYQLSPQVARFFDANTELQDITTNARNRLNAALGLRGNLLTGIDRAPNIDTAKNPYHFLVRQRPGTALDDGGTAVVTARNAEELEKKAAALRDDFQIITDTRSKQYHQAIGDYQADRNFQQTYVNNMLQRKGILNDLLPSTDPEAGIQDYLKLHERSILGLTRDHVEAMNGQTFAELDARSEQYRQFKTSIFGNDEKQRSLEIVKDDPFGSYRQTALNIGKFENYRPWAYAQQKLEAFGDSAFDAVANGWNAVRAGKATYEQVGDLWKQFGISTGFKEGTDELYKRLADANTLPDRRVISKFVSKANGLLSSVVIKLDPFQQFLHAVTSPMLSVMEASATARELASIAIPGATDAATGAAKTMPSITKVAFGAVNDLFDDALNKQYGSLMERVIGPRDASSQFNQLHNELANVFIPGATEKAINDVFAKAEKIAENISQVNNVESMTNKLAFHMGRRLFESQGIAGQDLEDNLNSFINRVKGNITASQRPVMFQGPVGAAISLFQTYQFNTLQSLFKHIGEGDTKSAALYAGMQSTLFGLQSLPGFHFINKAIADASGNKTHADIYSTAPQALGDQLSKWMLFGSVSNVLNANLFTRGDSNPRNMTLLPTNPLDFPSISGGIKLASSLYDVASKISNGAPIGSSLLLALEHNGMSRPLEGLAQLAQGFSTNQRGNLISKAWPNEMGINDMYQAGVFSRLVGARPLDEAIAMEMQYNQSMFKAQDNARIEELGKAVKSTLYAGGTPTGEQIASFATDYANRGGDIKNFGQHMIKWSNEANASVANKVFQQLGNPKAQTAMQRMGGQPLPDYRNAATKYGQQNADPTAPVDPLTGFPQ